MDEFLGSAVNPPEAEAVQTSLDCLRGLNALDQSRNDRLTPLGYHLALLPVHPRIGKMMLLAAICRCLSPVLTIGAAMSLKSPFVSPLDKREEADKAKRCVASTPACPRPRTADAVYGPRSEFAGDHSDHLALLSAFNEWTRAREKGRRTEFAFTRDHFLSRNTLSVRAVPARGACPLPPHC